MYVVVKEKQYEVPTIISYHLTKKAAIKVSDELTSLKERSWPKYRVDSAIQIWFFLAELKRWKKNTAKSLTKYSLKL